MSAATGFSTRGDPLCEGGLEYLFDIAFAEAPGVEGTWVRTREEEKRAFEARGRDGRKVIWLSHRSKQAEEMRQCCKANATGLRRSAGFPRRRRGL